MSIDRQKLILLWPVFLALVFLFLITGAAYSQHFKPAWWCRGAHLQTIAGGLFRSDPKVPLREERLDTPDGDFIVLDWLEGKGHTPLVVILHGLGGSSRVPYVHTLLKKIQALGWQAVAINARGTTEPNLLPETNHGGQTKDLDWTIRKILERKITDRIYLVGFSIGGNQALKWLGEQGVNAPIKKAVAISVPYNLAASVRNLDKGFNQKVYTSRMLKDLKQRALEKEHRFPGSLDRKKIADSKTFQVYDREATARLNGFKDETDYWQQSSSENYLSKIKRPTLLIHAADDPFLPERDLPVGKIKNSGYLELLLSLNGGHLGFVSGKCPFRLDDWLEQTILDFFTADETA